MKEKFISHLVSNFACIYSQESQMFQVVDRAFTYDLAGYQAHKPRMHAQVVFAF